MQKLNGNVVDINRHAPRVTEKLIRDVFEQHHRALEIFLRRFVRSEHEVADLAQDVYEKLCKQTLKDDWEQFPKSYILKTATSVIRDKFRRNTVRHENAHDTLDDHEPLSTQNNPQQSLEYKQGVDIVQQAVRDLPPNQRQVFLLHRLHNQTLKNISNTMGIPLRTVERYLSQAITLCHKRLKQEQWLSGND